MQYRRDVLAAAFVLGASAAQAATVGLSAAFFDAEATTLAEARAVAGGVADATFHLDGPGLPQRRGAGAGQHGCASFHVLGR